MKTNPVVWFEIYVNDMNRAQKFYETVLAVSLTDLPSPTGDSLQMKAFPMVENGQGATGALVKIKDMDTNGGFSSVVYFSCEDCALEESRVEDAGGKVHTEKMSIGEYGFVSLAFDTEGNMFGLHSIK